jgi:hypothetical protein
VLLAQVHQKHNQPLSSTCEGQHIGDFRTPAKAKTIVDILCEVVWDGKKEKMTLKDVAYVLDSLTKLMSNRWTMSGSKSAGIKMTKGPNVLNFDETIYTPKGILYVIVLKRRGETQAGPSVEAENDKEAAQLRTIEAGAAITVEEKIKDITINKAHAICRHMGQAEVWELCKICWSRYHQARVSAVCELQKGKSQTSACYTTQ